MQLIRLLQEGYKLDNGETFSTYVTEALAE